MSISINNIRFTKEQGKNLHSLPWGTDCKQEHNSGRSAGLRGDIAMTSRFRQVQGASLLKTQNSFPSTLGRLRAMLMCAPWHPLTNSDNIWQYATIWCDFWLPILREGWSGASSMSMAPTLVLRVFLTCPGSMKAQYLTGQRSNTVTMMPSPSYVEPRHPMQPITTT